MTTSQNVLTLLSGSVIEPAATLIAIFPEVIEYEDGTIVTLENDKHEVLGTAEITDVKTETFALIQNQELAHTCHPGTTTWVNALHTLATQAPGFSQLDKVSIVLFYIHAVIGVGLTINAADTVEPTGAEPAPPPVEDQYAGLGKWEAVEETHA